MSLKLDFSVVNKGEVQNKAIVMIHGWQGNKESFKYEDRNYWCSIPIYKSKVYC